MLDVTHILIPKQTGNSFSCTTDDEDDLAFYQLEHELMTVGWIHVTQYKSFIILFNRTEGINRVYRLIPLMAVFCQVLTFIVTTRIRD